MSAKKVLVVSATKAEAAYVPQEFELVITGIGKVSAARQSRRRWHGFFPDELPLVVNIGTAGALHVHHGGLFVPVSCQSRHQQCGDQIVRPRGCGSTGLVDGDDSVLATGDAFVSDAAVRDALAQRADLVDMEGFAVAYAARAAGLGAGWSSMSAIRLTIPLWTGRPDRCQRPRIGALAGRERL